MGGAHSKRNLRHPGLLILALAALWMQVLVPQGFMVASANTGPALVICTGHGPLLNPDHPGKAPKPASDAPCVFAAHGAVSAPPPPPLPAAPGFAPTTAAVQSFVAQTPGRGLAAPPPPSHAPPLLT